MAHFFVVLLLLPFLAGAADSPGELQAARLQSQHLINEAYLSHPAIPAGLLESQAWAATRWQHRVPTQAADPNGMPAVFGIFGLYSTNEYGFVDLLGEVAVFNGLSKTELMGSEKIYVDATASYLEEQIIRGGLAGQSIENFRPIVELSNDFTVKGHQHYADQTHTDPGINWDWPRYHSLANGGVITPAVNFLPEASFAFDCTGLSCSFDATASMDTDGAVVSYDWDFGDGAVGATEYGLAHLRSSRKL